MIRSMTGFGRAEGSYKGRSFVVELRSVNHRYCEVVVRLPKQLALLEEPIKKRVRGCIARGRIELSVSANGSADALKRFKIDLESADAYYRLLKKLKRELRLPGEIDIGLLSRFREVVTVVEPPEKIEPWARVINKTLDRAIAALEKMRQEEGRALEKDFSGHLRMISEKLSLIEGREEDVVRAYYRRLRKRVSELSENINIDPARLSQEAAIYAERSDISEERARLKTHIEQFRKMLHKKEAVGRSLDFLLQEMNREVNTIGSKANDAAISLHVVAMKGELEKMREQVQNIE
ncbi:MAG: YicC/YloC family endoribonuclease [Nitrospiria bacterium]